MTRLALWLSMILAVSRLEASTIEGKVVVRGAKDSRNAVIYIGRIPGKRFPPPASPVVLDQKNLTFVPHVLPVLAGTKIAFPNSDEIRHNVFSPTASSRFNLGTYPRNTTRYYVVEEPGPITLLCNVHTEMSAYVIVVETPYFATTDNEGRFSISDVPAGTYTLRFWHERTKPAVMEITVRDGETINLSMNLSK